MAKRVHTKDARSTSTIWPWAGSTPVHDAADKANEDEARAWELFDADRRDREERHTLERERVFNRVVQMHCLECGDEVPQARQLALPHTRRCFRCADQVERR
ncbi:TraR/DksA C4-type zinc finger protein [Xanthomonas campestris]|uniref:TraR/DksA C4-type zinc finger protein n=1 Tax=Xanthomonas campestris TaxID=339 RepID=UPI001E3FE853|nr:TraR/DksA C4-type zinc finger protein [Xanthomonas campestris]